MMATLLRLCLILSLLTVNTFGAGAVWAGEIIVPLMPVPGTQVALSQSFVPAHLKGITIHPDNALQFDFLIHKGDSPLDEGQKEEEYQKLVKYFLASLTIADEDQWVNLSPYENKRIIENNFGKTEMGRDLLSQDYLLKQITSSLMYPESGLGKTFWDKVYEKSYKEFGHTNIPVNTFNKVWIVPDEAVVYENGNTAYILKSHLKVMLEEDYLAMSRNELNNVGAIRESPSHGVNQIGSQIIREIILPAIEKEVNEGKNFAMLRQIYSGMVLATWYKKALKESLLGQVYANKAKVNGVTLSDASNQNIDDDPDKIYKKYLQAFKKGVYNYIKEDEDKYTHQIIPRKYFAGGFRNNSMIAVTRNIGFNQAQTVAQDLAGSSEVALVGLNPSTQQFNLAMKTDDGNKTPKFVLDRRRFWGSLASGIAGTVVAIQEALAITEKAKEFFELNSKLYDFKPPFTKEQLGQELDKHVNIMFNDFKRMNNGLVPSKGFISKEVNISSAVSFLNDVHSKNPEASFDDVMGAIKQHVIQMPANESEAFKYGIALWIHRIIDETTVFDPKLIDNPGLARAFDGAVGRVLISIPRLDNINRVHTCVSFSDMVLWMAQQAGIDEVEIIPVTLMEDGRSTDQSKKEIGHVATIFRGKIFQIQLDQGKLANHPKIIAWDGQGNIVRADWSGRLPAHLRGENFEMRLQTILVNIEQNVLYALQDHIPSDSQQALVIYKDMEKRLKDLQINPVLKRHKIIKENVEKLLAGTLEAIEVSIHNQGATAHNQSVVKYKNWRSRLEKASYNQRTYKGNVKAILIEVKAYMKTQEYLAMATNDSLKQNIKQIEITIEKDHEIRVTDKAAVANPGGIDLNAANLNLQIKRNGAGVPLPLAQQDMAQLSQIEGFVPKIIEIKPAVLSPLFTQLQQQKIQEIAQEKLSTI